MVAWVSFLDDFCFSSCTWLNQPGEISISFRHLQRWLHLLSFSSAISLILRTLRENLLNMNTIQFTRAIQYTWNCFSWDLWNGLSKTGRNEIMVMSKCMVVLCVLQCVGLISTVNCRQTAHSRRRTSRVCTRATPSVTTCSMAIRTNASSLTFLTLTSRESLLRKYIDDHTPEASATCAPWST